MINAIDRFGGRFDYCFVPFVNGDFVSLEHGSDFSVVNPATGKQWATVRGEVSAVAEATRAATDAQRKSDWARDPLHRASVLRRIADLVEDEIEALAGFEMLGTGKTIAAARVEIAYAAVWYRYYASVVETERESSLAISATKTAQILSEPIGVVGAITPFNGAFSLGTWKFAPALAAGNAVVVKPPVESSVSTLLLAEIMTAAGVPAGIFNVVLGGTEVGEALVSDDRIGMVTFTGSTGVGRSIGSTVAGRLAKFVCEAGGKSAHIVMDDADLDSAVIAAAQGVFSGSGQTCVAGSRLLVHADVYDEFIERFTAHSAKITVGDPMSDVHLGPIATRKQYERVVSLIDTAVAEGASLLLDGRDPKVSGAAGGFWVGPTILAHAGRASTICRTEVFGPVVVVERISSLEDAISFANDSDYGLAAGIWTSSQAVAHEASRKLEAGTVWVNTYRGMDWRTPFGGYKQSGIGRENGIESIAEFRETKTVVQDVAPAIDPFAIA